MAKKRTKAAAKRRARTYPVSPEQKLLADVHAGKACPRAEVVAIVGKDQKIAWWDMRPIEDYGFAPAGLEPGQFRTCGLDDIPTPVWQKHLADYARDGGHGLNLAADPAIMGVFRYDDGKFGMLVGYAARGY